MKFKVGDIIENKSDGCVGIIIKVNIPPESYYEVYWFNGSNLKSNYSLFWVTSYTETNSFVIG